MKPIIFFKKALEIIWLSIAIVALGMFMWIYSASGWSESYPLAIIFVVSVFMYFFRRKMRHYANRQNEV